MSLKSIRESYSKLLTAFADAGVVLSESQKADVDSFVLAIESNMSRQRETAIRQTKKLVEAKMEREYRKAFESVMESMRENAALAAKIQEKVARIDEHKKVAGQVDGYLDLYVESVLPRKTVVDYDRMQKLEKLHESLKDVLVAGDDAVEAKVRQLEESYRVKQSKCETEVARVTAKLNESSKFALELKRELDAAKAVQLLESKTKDLPAYEAKAVKKVLNGAVNEKEVDEKFGKTLECVKKDMKKVAEEKEAGEEAEVKSEVEKILEGEDGEDEVTEDDMLKDRPHNGHVPAGVAEEDDEDFETMETVEFDEEGDVRLDESEVIDADLMSMWCNQSVERT